MINNLRWFLPSLCTSQVHLLLLRLTIRNKDIRIAKPRCNLVSQWFGIPCDMGIALTLLLSNNMELHLRQNSLFICWHSTCCDNCTIRCLYLTFYLLWHCTIRHLTFLISGSTFPIVLFVFDIHHYGMRNWRCLLLLMTQPWAFYFQVFNSLDYRLHSDTARLQHPASRIRLVRSTSFRNPRRDKTSRVHKTRALFPRVKWQKYVTAGCRLVDPQVSQAPWESWTF